MSTHRKLHSPVQTPTSLVLPGRAMDILAHHFMDDLKPRLSRDSILVLDAGELRHSVVVWNVGDRIVENLTALHNMRSIFAREHAPQSLHLLELVGPFLRHMEDKSVGVGMFIPKPDGTIRRIVSPLSVDGFQSLKTAMVSRTQLLSSAVKQAFHLESWKPTSVIGGRFFFISDTNFSEPVLPFYISSALATRGGIPMPEEQLDRIVFFVLGYDSPIPPYELLQTLMHIEQVLPGKLPHVLVYGHPTEHTIDLTAWSATADPRLRPFLDRTFEEAQRPIRELEKGYAHPHIYPPGVLVAISKKWASIFSTLVDHIFMRVKIFDGTGSQVEALPLSETPTGADT